MPKYENYVLDFKFYMIKVGNTVAVFVPHKGDFVLSSLKGLTEGKLNPDALYASKEEALKDIKYLKQTGKYKGEISLLLFRAEADIVEVDI